MGRSARPPLGSFSSRLCSSSGVVMTKIISNTNARSSNGVMLMSLKVTSELRWENRRMISSLIFCAEQFILVFQIFDFHPGDEFLGEIIEIHGQHAKVVDEPVVAKHGGNGDEQTGHGGDQGSRHTGRHC